MAAPVLRIQLFMDCVEGAWEPLDGGWRCQFHGTVRVTMRSLVRPEEPLRVVEAFIEWEQSTPTIFGGDALTPLMGTPPVTKEEGDPEEDLEEDPEEDPVDVPVPMVKEESVNGPERTLSSKPLGGDSESSYRWRMEWLDHRNLLERASAVEHSASAEGIDSSTAFSAVKVVGSQVDRAGPSGAASAASSFGSNSGEDSERTEIETSSSGDLW